MEEKLTYTNRINNYIESIKTLLFIFKYITPRTCSLLGNNSRETSEALKRIVEEKLAIRKNVVLTKSKHYSLIIATKKLLIESYKESDVSYSNYHSEANGRAIPKDEKYHLALLSELSALLLSLGYELEYHHYFETIKQFNKNKEDDNEYYYFTYKAPEKVFYPRRFIKQYLSSDGSFSLNKNSDKKTRDFEPDSIKKEISNDSNSPLFGIIKNKDFRFHIYLLDRHKNEFNFNRMKEYSISYVLDKRNNFFKIDHSKVFGEKQINIILLGAESAHDNLICDLFDSHYIKKYEQSKGYQKPYPNKQFNIEDYDFNTFVIPFNNNNKKVKQLFEETLKNNPIEEIFNGDGSKNIYMPVLELNTLWTILKSYMNQSLFVTTIKIVTLRINLNLLINYFNSFKYFTHDDSLTLMIFDIETEEWLYTYEMTQNNTNWQKAIDVDKPKENQDG